MQINRRRHATDRPQIKSIQSNNENEKCWIVMQIECQSIQKLNQSTDHEFGLIGGNHISIRWKDAAFTSCRPCSLRLLNWPMLLNTQNQQLSPLSFWCKGFDLHYCFNFIGFTWVPYACTFAHAHCFSTCTLRSIFGLGHELWKMNEGTHICFLTLRTWPFSQDHSDEQMSKKTQSGLICVRSLSQPVVWSDKIISSAEWSWYFFDFPFSFIKGFPHWWWSD